MIGTTAMKELTSLDLSAFIGKSSSYVINCLKLSHVTIYRAKWLGSDSKFWPTNCFPNNWK